jgi:hypothetical protein
MIAISLLLGRDVAISASLAGVCLAFATGVVLRDKQNLDCGCFGPTAVQGDHHGLIALRNGTMLAVACVVALDDKTRPFPDLPTLALGMLLLLASIGSYIIARALLSKPS